MLKYLGVALAALVVVAAGTWFYITYQPTPDKRLFINGQVLTMDDSNTIAEALLTEGGRIIAVGGNDEVRAQADADTIVTDLGGKTLMPGIIDAHGHFPGTGLAAVAADLNSPPIGDIETMEQLLARLSLQVEDTPAGRWVMGFGYDDTAMAEGRHPTRDELDGLSREHPIFVWHISGHMGVVNSAALEIMGYTAATPDPEGGTLGRDPDSGELNGLLQETAVFAIQEHAMDFSFLDFLKMIEHAASQYASVGVTTAQSAGADGRMSQGLSIGQTLNLVPFRLVVFPLDGTLGTKVLEGSFDPDSINSDRFSLGAVKIISDGSIQGYTGYLSKPYHVPYHGDTNYRGHPVVSREDLFEIVDAYHAAGMQLAIHANGDAAIDNVIDAFRAAQESTPVKTLA